MEKDPHEGTLNKLTSDMRILEQELTKMANRLGALNQQVNDEQLKNKKLKEEYSNCQSKLQTRVPHLIFDLSFRYSYKQDKQISQEAQDKRILAAKIAKIEKANAKLRKILAENNLNILEAQSTAPVFLRRHSNHSDEQEESNTPRKDSLTDQINKNIENVFK